MTRFIDLYPIETRRSKYVAVIRDEKQTAVAEEYGESAFEALGRLVFNHSEKIPIEFRATVHKEDVWLRMELARRQPKVPEESSDRQM